MSALHPVTLSFRDPALEAAYRASTEAAGLRSLRIGLSAALIAWLATAAALTSVPWASRHVAIEVILVVMVPGVVLALVITRWARGFGARQRVGGGANLLAGVVAVWITSLEGVPPGGTLPAYLLITPFAYFLLGLRFTTATICTWSVAVYALIVEYHRSAVFPVAAFMIIVGVVSHGLAAWLLEAARRNAFDKDRALRAEQQRTRDLLHELLPSEVVERLSAGERIIADRHAAVSALFADIEGFTKLSQVWPAERVVDLLHDVFSRIDDLARRHGVEKIKTIGDAYMAVAGVPIDADDHAERIARLAIDIRDEIHGMSIDAGVSLRLRIGLHAGPAVSGVIATDRRAFDVWGDTINTASRMESYGSAGRIHVTEAFRDALGPGWRFEERGAIEVRGKGRMQTYFLLGRGEPESS